MWWDIGECETTDLTVDQGVPFSFSIKTGVDPTGWDAHLQVRDQPNGLVFADLGVDTGLTIDTAKRSIDCLFTVDQVALFALQCVWDLLVTPEGGSPERLAGGTVYVSPGVTQ